METSVLVSAVMEREHRLQPQATEIEREEKKKKEVEKAGLPVTPYAFIGYH